MKRVVQFFSSAHSLPAAAAPNPLVTAAATGDIGRIRASLSNKSPEESFLDVLRMALLEAAANEHLEIVTLIQSYFKTHQRDLQDVFEKAFVIAASKGNLKTVQYIASLPGFDIAVKPSNGRGGTALIYAAQNGHLPIVQYLVEDRHAAIGQQVANPSSSVAPLTPLDFAALMGQFEVVKYLAEKDAASDHRRAIDAAIDGCNIRVANYLLWVQFKKGIWPFETKLDLKNYPFFKAIAKGELIVGLHTLFHIIGCSQSPEAQIRSIKKDILSPILGIIPLPLLSELHASIADILLKECPNKAWELMKFFVPEESKLAEIKLQVEGGGSASSVQTTQGSINSLALPDTVSPINM